MTIFFILCLLLLSSAGLVLGLLSLLRDMVDRNVAAATDVDSPEPSRSEFLAPG